MKLKGILLSALFVVIVIAVVSRVSFIRNLVFGTTPSA